MIRNNSSALEAADHLKLWDVFIYRSLQNNQNNFQRKMLLFKEQAQRNINVVTIFQQPGSSYFTIIEVRIAVVSIDRKLMNMNKTLTYSLSPPLTKAHERLSAFCSSETRIVSYISKQYKQNKIKIELAI
jgi:hypothetical protein